MGFFSNLIKLTIDVAVTPIAIVKDVVTLGGTTVDKGKPYTVKKLEDIEDDLNEIKDSLGEFKL